MSGSGLFSVMKSQYRVRSSRVVSLLRWRLRRSASRRRMTEATKTMTTTNAPTRMAWLPKIVPSRPANAISPTRLFSTKAGVSRETYRSSQAIKLLNMMISPPRQVDPRENPLHTGRRLQGRSNTCSSTGAFEWSFRLGEFTVGSVDTAPLRRRGITTRPRLSETREFSRPAALFAEILATRSAGQHQIREAQHTPVGRQVLEFPLVMSLADLGGARVVRMGE